MGMAFCLCTAEGADPDIETLDTGNTPLFACLERPLHAAAGAADALKPPAPLPLVRSLISAGCDVDHENRGGVTPLQAALDRENCDAALLLLSADCRSVERMELSWRGEGQKFLCSLM